MKRNALKKMPVLLVPLLGAITFGAYIGYWFYSRSEQLDKLSNKKAGRFPIGLANLAALVGLISSGSVLAWFAASYFGPSESATIFGMLRQMLGLATWIFWILLAFDTRKILASRYKRSISAGMTFFFGVIYLQYVINRLGVAAKRGAKRRLKVSRNER
jgi:hypothetical protein